MSKLTTDEVVKRTKDALNAVANYLHRGSTKSFMFGGEKPTKVKQHSTVTKWCNH